LIFEDKVVKISKLKKKLPKKKYLTKGMRIIEEKNGR
jgi:hypothetical protein